MKTNYNKINKAKSEQRIDVVETTPGILLDEALQQKEKIVRAIVTCSRLNVRESANVNSKIICVINEFDKVTISPIQGVDINDDWAHIQLNNGTLGYVMGKFIKEVKEVK